MQLGEMSFYIVKIRYRERLLKSAMKFTVVNKIAEALKKATKIMLHPIKKAHILSSIRK